MRTSFISLCSDAPAGFEYRNPEKRDLLGGIIALYTSDSPESVFSLLDDFCQRVRGIIITPGDRFISSPIGPQLWHLQVTESDLYEMASSFLTILSQGQATLQKNKTLTLERNRLKRDYQQVRDSYNVYTERLGGKIEDLRLEIERRKNAEKELEMFKAFAETSSQGMGWSNENGTLIYSNPALATLLGEEDALAPLGKNVATSYYAPEEQQKLSGEILPYIMKEGAWTGELILQQKDGTQLLTHNSLFLIHDPDNQSFYFANLVIDIREMKKTEKELLKIKKLESIGVLAGGIAHDFNNILAAILGNIELAAMSIESTNEAQTLLKEAQKASIRAKDLTQQLLTFSKGGAPVKQTAFLDKIITESADFVLHGTSVRCDYDFADDLWQADIDPGQISQVIQNIIINACHAMPIGGTITVSCKNSTLGRGAHPRKAIKIEITDLGSGISPENIEKIFDPYFSTKQTGNGLGLAICHSIITKHEGSISVESEAGKGTTFTLYLPAAQQEQATDSQIGSTQEIPLPPEKYLILVMDDEPMIRNIAQMMLSRLGHEVVLASDGDEAIRLYHDYLNKGQPIDLTIMDLTIPGGMGGQEAVLEILKINSTAKVLVSSGYSNDPIMASCKDYGFSGSIAKPFHMNELAAALHAVFS